MAELATAPGGTPFAFGKVDELSAIAQSSSPHTPALLNWAEMDRSFSACRSDETRASVRFVSDGPWSNS